MTQQNHTFRICASQHNL